MKLLFREMKKEAQNAYSFIFDPNPELKWNAGEYLEVKLPHNDVDDRGIERYFSISSAPSEDIVMITTRFFEEEASTFKKAFFELKTGESIEVSKPTNSETFFNVNDPKREYVFLTAGIGITPVRSVVKEYHLKGRNLKGTLLYANRDDEYIFGAQLERMAKNMPSFTVQKYHDKRIDRGVIEGLLKEFNKPIFNISGTKQFNLDMKEILGELNIDSENIKTSSFGEGYKAQNM